MNRPPKLLALFLVITLSLGTIAAAPSPPQPNITITLVEGLPSTMQVGETHMVTVQITSDIPFIYATALPDMYYPGRYVVANGNDLVTHDTSAILQIPFTAKDATDTLPNGVAPVAVVAGVRFSHGIVFVERFDFSVSVP